MSENIQSDLLVVVDVQPFYEESCERILQDIITKIEQSSVPVVYYYVGEEIANETKADVMMYLLKNGLSEDKCSEIRFIEKDYGFYRPFMDSGVSSESILEVLKTMKSAGFSNIHDVQNEGYDNIFEMDSTLSNKISQKDMITMETLLRGGDQIYEPNFNDKCLKGFPTNSKAELIGGGRWECLEEIAIHLKLKEFDVSVNEKLCYGTEPIDLKKNKKKKRSY